MNDQKLENRIKRERLNRRLREISANVGKDRLSYAGNHRRDRLHTGCSRNRQPMVCYHSVRSDRADIAVIDELDQNDLDRYADLRLSQLCDNER